MLKPDERAHLLELLRPPAGYELHTAVGTTYSLDLISALTVPLSFALFDWEDDEGRPTGDPLALLEALRRHGERFTLFCQAGQIRLPGKYPPLVAFLESSIFEARSPDPEGAFHPKVWVLRFVGEEGEIAYRVLCLSRNLTFDRSWDTVVSLDGTLSDRRTTIRKNLPLAEFVAALPTLAVGAIPDSRRKDIQLIAAELKRVRFTWPSGFEDAECRFWPGIPDLPSPDFGERRDASLIVSPFVSESVIRSFLEAGGPVHLVSRAETLDELPRELLRDCASIHTLQSQLNEECSEADNTSGLMDVLDGLHAKVFVVDHGRSASVFTGSFNATRHALDHNVEFMVEMVGKKSRHGVGSWLRNENGETRFADLLQSYSTEAAGEAGDSEYRDLERQLLKFKRAITDAGPALSVSESIDGDQLHDLRFGWQSPPQWPPGDAVMRIWPITLLEDRALKAKEGVVFSRLSLEGLTPLIAFSLRLSGVRSKLETTFVMRLPVEGMPEDRKERLLANLIQGKDQLLRYLLFLLAAGRDASQSGQDLARLLARGDAPRDRQPPALFLLESLLRALHRNRPQVERVASLITELRRGGADSELLGEEFDRIWNPIWELARRKEGE